MNMNNDHKSKIICISFPKHQPEKEKEKENIKIHPKPNEEAKEVVWIVYK